MESIRDTHQPSGFFAIRTPLLPFDEIENWGSGLIAADYVKENSHKNSLSTESLKIKVESDRQLLRSRLRKLLDDPQIADALFVATPVLNDELRRKGDDRPTKKTRRAERSAVKYYMRMASRCTPFGLFAGASVGTFGDTTSLELQTREKYRRHTRLDMDYLTALADALGKDKKVRRQLLLRPNSSIYRIGDRIRYAENRLVGRARSYFLVVADEDDYLRDVLGRARNGAFRKDLAESLVQDEITIEDALAYVDELIDAQILVPDLAPTITGAEAINDLISQLGALKETAPTTHKVLADVLKEINAIDSDGIGVLPDRYRDVASSLEALPVDTNLSRLFQVDMTKPVAQMTLSQAVLDDISRGVEVLHSLFGIESLGSLDEFRNQFRERYEDRELPLVEVLDEDLGIGFEKSNTPEAEASPLLDGLQFPIRTGEERITWSTWTSFLQRRLVEALTAGDDELVLTDEDLKRFADRRRLPPPDAFQVTCRILPPSEDVSKDGENRSNRQRISIEGSGGPSGARLLGRFCHADAELHRRVEEHLRAEEAARPDAVFCEIVHHPEGRIGNILSRPVLRNYELVYLGRSGAPQERQIDVNDLLISVVGDRIVLRSRRLGKEVIPRLTTAHNTRYRALGIYRFLAALQVQGTSPSMTWQWGTLGRLPFLPRVRYRDLYFSTRMWNASQEEIKGITSGDDEANFAEVQRWRIERGLPRYVGLADGDNVLTVDLDNPLSIDAFLALIKDRPTILLRDVDDMNDLTAKGPEGSFQHEINIPFVKKPPEVAESNTVAAPNRQQKSTTARKRSGQRVFSPGSEWLFIKLYSGPAAADRILLDVLQPITQEALASKTASKWFFIRYGDPHYHLRARYYGDPRTLSASILPQVNEAIAPLMDDRLVWRVQLDTYDREMDRYGGAAGIELCETIFQADSDAVLGILGLHSGDASADVRWRLALKGMDALLDDLGFNLTHKCRIMAQAADGFSRELGITGNFRKRVLDRYRTERKAITELLNNGNDNVSTLSAGISLLEERSERVRPIAKELHARSENGELTTPLDSIAQSLLHMHANRMLRSAARAQEALIYNFLLREYDSQLARMGIKKADRKSEDAA